MPLSAVIITAQRRADKDRHDVDQIFASLRTGQSRAQRNGKQGIDHVLRAAVSQRPVREAAHFNRAVEKQAEVVMPGIAAENIEERVQRVLRAFKILHKMIFGGHQRAGDGIDFVVALRNADNGAKLLFRSAWYKKRVGDIEQRMKIAGERRHSYGTNGPARKFPVHRRKSVTDTVSIEGFWKSFAARNTLDAAALDALLGLPARRRKLGAGATVGRGSPTPRDCSFLLSGFAQGSKLLRDGSRQIVSVYVPGDFLGLGHLLGASSIHEARMMTPGSVATVTKSALNEVIAGHPALQTALWRQTAVEASIFSEWLTGVGRRDAQGRIAHLLCEFAVRLRAVGLANESKFDLPMTQSQIADATGLTSVHVNRVLNGLREAGVVATQKRTISIHDWTGLAAIADFEPAYLGKLRTQPGSGNPFLS